MPAAWLALALVFAVALMLAASSVSRRLRRVKRAAGAAAVPPARPQAAGGMAVPVQPPGEEREPFRYGGIVAIEAHDEEDKP